jgi:hypothetical protein
MEYDIFKKKLLKYYCVNIRLRQDEVECLLDADEVECLLDADDDDASDLFDAVCSLQEITNAFSVFVDYGHLVYAELKALVKKDDDAITLNNINAKTKKSRQGDCYIVGHMLEVMGYKVDWANEIIEGISYV